MPYLEIKKQEEKQIVEMPDFIGLNLKEAKQVLNELKLEVSIDGEETNESIITDQIPKKGIAINEGTKVILKVDNKNE